MQFSYRKDIDGLRALAIITVVLFHAKFSTFAGGFVGVDVFFVISGFLITTHLLSEQYKTGTISLINFYSKRLKRLYPAIIFTILITAVLMGVLFWGYDQNIKDFVTSVKYALFGVANFYFLRKEGDYFNSTTDDDPLLHFWSLGVEEQFYLIWPLIILLIYKLKPKKISKERILAFVLTLICLSSFLLSQYYVDTLNASKSFYMMGPRLWELGVGALLALNYKKRFNFDLSDNIRGLITLIGLTLILVPVFYYDNSTPFPGVYAIPPVLGTSLLVFFGTTKNSKLSLLLENKPLVQIGVLSYGWYLWHWPFLSFLHIQYLDQTPPLSLRLMAIFASLLMAVISLEFIEKPIRFGEKINLLKPKMVLAGWLTLSLATFAICFGIKNLNDSLTPNPLGNKFEERMRAAATIDHDCIKNGELHSDCIINNHSQKTVFIIGDSHAKSLAEPFVNFANESKVNLKFIVNNGQLPLKGYSGNYNHQHQFDRSPSSDFYSLISEDQASEKSIVLIARWNTYLGKTISVTHKEKWLSEERNRQASLALFKEYLLNTISFFEAEKIKKVLIVLQFPEFKYDTEVCSSYDLSNCMTTIDQNHKYREDTLNLIQSAVKHHSNIQIIDPLNYFCINGECPQIVKDNDDFFPITSDDNHPSRWSALVFGNKIKDNLLWLIN